ncbi:MAG: SMC-Scp complex subunit ScpB [Gammaproteobacteria bacterium]|nr:MAG: SMC-Scp complex subunit ScpB [Gammaproteobacteria bacterium]
MTDENLITEENLEPEEIGVEDLASAADLKEEAGEPATVAVTQQPVDKAMLRKIVEGAILAAAQPITVARILELFDEEVAPAKDEILAALQDIQADNDARGFELKEVASGWRFQVREELAPWVNRMWDEKPQKYSRALLETLSLIAYRQPITRGDIEEIRGVAVSSHIMKTLMERDWVKVVGHRDVPGRPSLYATTRQFLDYFNLKNLEDLPSLSEIRDLDEMNNVLNLGDEEGIGEKDDEVIPDAPAVIIADESVEAELEEFVDGEEAFVDADDDSRVDVDEDVSPQAGIETNAESSADNAQDVDENTHEENNNV